MHQTQKTRADLRRGSAAAPSAPACTSCLGALWCGHRRVLSLCTRVLLTRPTRPDPDSITSHLRPVDHGKPREQGQGRTHIEGRSNSKWWNRVSMEIQGLAWLPLMSSLCYGPFTERPECSGLGATAIRVLLSPVSESMVCKAALPPGAALGGPCVHWPNSVAR